jgi:hypothetical protein
VLAITQVIIELAFQRPFDHHLGQLAQQPALAGKPHPAGAGPLGKLTQNLLIGCGQRDGSLALAARHVSHWCLLSLWSYTFEITVPLPRLLPGKIAGGDHALMWRSISGCRSGRRGCLVLTSVGS